MDGFVDFYDVLGAQQDATTTHLRRRINELYSEAQSNRDHRNPSKRRRYEALCELLPFCRIVLLDPDKRARYDKYREDVHAGTPGTPDFETAMEEIAGSVGPDLNSGEKIGLLGVEGDDDYLPVTDEGTSTTGAVQARSEKGAIAANATTVAPTVEDSVTLTGAAGTKRRVSRSASQSLMGSAFSVIAFAVICSLIWFLSHNLERAVLVAAIVAIIVWVVTHRRPTPIK
jgi:hypothetical protein